MTGLGRGSPPSGSGSIQELQQLVRRQLDLLVSPLGGAVVAGDQARAVQAAEVSVDEGVTRLGLLRSALGEAEVPLRVVAPIV
jgi:hypothetical protein